MSIEGILISLGITACFIMWLLLPLFNTAHSEEAVKTSIERQRERLNVYYERVLQNVHDLDEDHATGKLDEHDYRIERERWVQRGVQALKALDELDATHLVAPAAADDAAIDAAIDRVIEDAIDGQQREITTLEPSAERDIS